MAVLLSGRLGVTLDEGDHPHYVAMVEAGELCGEMAELLGTARTADLRALDECDVLVLPHDLLDRIAAKDQAAALRISRQLNLLLSRRLRGMNEHLAALSRRDSRPARPLWSAAVPPDDACGVAGTPAAAKESYSIVTLEDPEKELARLEMQAECGWELELFWLRRLGLSDRATFLDVGSGPGVISCLLATAFAESKVVGVEPEPMLRQRAAARAARLGLGDRCRFLEGTGEALPLEPHSVDHSYARFLFQHIPQPVAMLKELARVTRPGGLVVVLDVDDEAVVVHPEPAGLRDFQQRAAEAQRRLGGDRHVARKMVEYMTVAGLASPQIEVAPITSRELALPMLVEAAFTFKAQTLRRSGLWLDKDGDTLSELASLPARPGAWMMVPVFFAHARGQ
jgi:ubiquinone/menaquinone biosynthesis C-methylase UbiE